VLELCSKAGFRPAVMQEARDASTMIGLVSSGSGVAIVPDAARCVQLPGVLYSRILDKEAVSSLYLAYRADTADPHLDALLNILRSTINAKASAPRSAGRNATTATA
jgi:DNA-binding transcriptional LysR family regulator